MTNNIRVFLWLGLLFVLFLNWTQWQADYGPKPGVSATPTGTNAAEAAKPTSLDDTVPQATQPAAPAPDSAPVAVSPDAASPAVEANDASQLVLVTTDVLVIRIDLRGGTLVYAALPGYPVVKGESTPVVLFNRDSAATNYTLQSGLAGGKADDVRPTHRAQFTSASAQYSLADGQDELRVPLTWIDTQGVTVTKTFVFHRSMFTIGLEYSIDNKTAAPWPIASYMQISRVDPKVEQSMFRIETRAFRGPAIYGLEKTGPGEKNKYRRLDIEKPADQNLSVTVTDGWLAGLQHHFVSAIVPDRTKPYLYTLRANDRHYLLTAVGPAINVAPGAHAVFKEHLYVGPKLQKQLASLHGELDRVADYGWLYLMAKPLFWLLEKVHGIVHNWGLAIIIATFLLKLLFYPLSEKAGRSMARMRTLSPRLKALQETYKDDRSKLGQATMELYKTEKVNPLAGCLPMLIQAPVFFAFYWVLLESAEMRQAPFFGWINDLSSRDPYFILPVLNGAAMWFQQKLNPPPPDPMQAKLFQFMPVIFSVMFALFPAGLVLYWVTNTGLTILQQWNINRKIELEEKTRRR